MSDEIDEFIRRAAERRKQQAQGQRRPAQRPAQAAPPSQAPRERQRPRTLEPEVLEAEIVEDVSASVNRHLSTRDFDDRSSQFGEQPGLADDRVEERIHQTFDHQLGRLARSTTGVAQPATVRSATDNAAAVTTTAANESLRFLITALSTPQNLRQAVILSEILARPEHQW